MPRFGGQTRQKRLFQRFALPVGEDLLPHKAPLLVRDQVRILRACGKVVHFTVYPLPRKLRRQNAAFAVFPDCADNQLALEDMHAKPGAAVVKCLCAADADGLSRALFVGFCPKCGAFAGDLRLGVYIVLAYFFNSCGKHFQIPPCGKQATEKPKGAQHPMRCGTPLCADEKTGSRTLPVRDPIVPFLFCNDAMIIARTLKNARAFLRDRACITGSR